MAKVRREAVVAAGGGPGAERCGLVVYLLVGGVVGGYVSEAWAGGKRERAPGVLAAAPHASLE